jgi:hypothetical protein
MAAPLKDSFGPDVPGRIARAIVAVHATFPADGGDPAALDVLGFGGSESAVVDEVRLEPSRPRIGESIRITAVVGNAGDRGAAFNVDLRVQLVKSNGARSPKVVKLREVNLAAGERVTLSKVVSLRQQTRLTHHPGERPVDLLINGTPHPAGSFVLG